MEISCAFPTTLESHEHIALAEELGFERAWLYDTPQQSPVWAANALGGVVSRVAPGGRIVDEVAMPEGLSVFACGLGGEDGRTLIACAAPDFHEEARSAAREAVLLTTTVEVPRAGLP